MVRLQLSDEEASDIGFVLAWAADMLVGNANDLDETNEDPALSQQLRHQAEVSRRIARRLGVTASRP